MSLLEVLTGFFNFPFEVVGPEIEYSGTTVPAMVDLYEVWDRIKAGTVSDFFGR